MQSLVGHGRDDSVVVVGGVDVAAWFHDFVDAVQDLVVEDDVGAGQQVIELFGRTWTDEFPRRSPPPPLVSGVRSRSASALDAG
jgi:hypothetical protein